MDTTPLGPSEQHQLRLVQTQNERGVGVDGELLGKCLALGELHLARIQQELQEVSGGELKLVARRSTLPSGDCARSRNPAASRQRSSISGAW